MEPEAIGDFTKQLIEIVGAAPTWLSCAMLFLCSFIEYVFPPFPGDSVLVAGGFFVAQGAIPVVPSVLSLVAGSLVGTATGWYIGFLARENERVRTLVFRILGENNFAKITQAYERHGNLILVVNRFLPGIRGVFVMAAGFTRIPFASVLIFGAISSFLWIALLLGLGFFLSENLNVLLDLFKTYTQVVIGGVVVFVLVWLIRGYFARRRRK